MTGRRLIVLLIGIVLATAVLPPALAWTVNRHRVSRAMAETSALADVFRGALPHLKILAATTDVLCGLGHVPAMGTEGANARAGTLRAALVQPDTPVMVAPDPWGNCYLVNISALRTGSDVVWILSAGPNGAVETPLKDSRVLQPRGDDIAVRLR